MNASRTTATARAARYIVADAYDTARSAGYLDLANSRRRDRVERLRREARDAARAEGLPGLTSATVNPSDVVDAFRAEARRALAPSHAGASVRNALRRTIGVLEDADWIGDDPAPLEDVLHHELGLGVELERIPVRTDRAALRAGRAPRTVEA